MQCFNQNRRNIVHQLRSETGPQIFSDLAVYRDIKIKQRITHPAFTSALMFPGDTKVTKYTPILFPDGIKNMKKMFQCKHLALASTD